MIRHIVFFSAKRGVDATTVRDGLMTLGDIPTSTHFEVALNSKVDPWSSEVDVVVYAETTARVRPMRELRFSADFEAAV